MEVSQVTSSMDFHFNSPANPISPSTPKLIGDHHLLIAADHQPITYPATIPFAWEEKPGVPNSLYNFSKRPSSASSKTTRRTKSLSQLNDPEEKEKEREKQHLVAGNTKRRLVSSCSTLSATSKDSRKWSFKDLFLFRSASDGRAMDRDPLKKYWEIFRKHDQDLRSSSLQSIEHRGHGSGSMTKKRGPVSAHELHYTVNRAVSNDMRKKSFLPYKQGILGRLAFNPTVHALSNGFGFSRS